MSLMYIPHRQMDDPVDVDAYREAYNLADQVAWRQAMHMYGDITDEAIHEYHSLLNQLHAELLGCGSRDEYLRTIAEAHFLEHLRDVSTK